MTSPSLVGEKKSERRTPTSSAHSGMIWPQNQGHHTTHLLNRQEISQIETKGIGKAAAERRSLFSYR